MKATTVVEYHQNDGVAPSVILRQVHLGSGFYAVRILSGVGQVGQSGFRPAVDTMVIIDSVRRENLLAAAKIDLERLQTMQEVVYFEAKMLDAQHKSLAAIQTNSEL